jgi:hypothetical protein
MRLLLAHPAVFAALSFAAAAATSPILGADAPAVALTATTASAALP